MKETTKTTMICLLAISLLTAGLISRADAQDKPNILVIWGDDIGISNISHNNRGMMGYHDAQHRPHRPGRGSSFTDYYGQQSCTAGRAAFIGGQRPGPHRHDQGRAARAPRRAGRRPMSPSPPCSRPRATPPGSSARTTWATSTNTCPPCTGSMSSWATSTTSTPRKSPSTATIPRRPETAERQNLPRAVRPARRHQIQGRRASGGQSDRRHRPADASKRMETIDEETVAAAKDFMQAQTRGRRAVLLLVERHPHALPHTRQA